MIKTIMALMAVVIILPLQGSSQVGKQHYVSVAEGNDGNNGDKVTPFQSIQHAIEMASPGDTIQVEAGIYRELIFLGTSKAGLRKTLGLTLMADTTKGKVIIDGTGRRPEGQVGLITIQNTEKVNVVGFEIRNFRTPVANYDSAAPAGILVSGSCRNIQIVGNNIHHIENNSTCRDSSGCGPSANGIGVFGKTEAGIQDILLAGNRVHDCILSSSEAFVLNGNVSQFIVKDNWVYDNNNIGFDFIGYEDSICVRCPDSLNRARDGLVINNTAKRNSTRGKNRSRQDWNHWYRFGKKGIDKSAAGFYVDGGSRIILDGNTSTGNDLGFSVASERLGKTADNIIVRNNYVYLNLEGGIVLGGSKKKKNGGGNRIYIINNSFYKNKGWATEIELQQHLRNCRYENNIFYGEESVAESYANNDSVPDPTSFWGKNIWYGNNQSDLTDIPGEVLMEDPRFMNPISGDLTIDDTSLAINNGAPIKPLHVRWETPFWEQICLLNCYSPLQGVKDREGNPRQIGPLDLGAFEVK